MRSSIGTSADCQSWQCTHVGQPNALHEFDGHARKFRKALGIVGIIAVLIAIKVFAVKKCGIVDKEIADAGMGRCPSPMAGNRSVSPRATVTLETRVEVILFPR